MVDDILEELMNVWLIRTSLVDQHFSNFDVFPKKKQTNGIHLPIVNYMNISIDYSTFEKLSRDL